MIGLVFTLGDHDYQAWFGRLRLDAVSSAKAKLQKATRPIVVELRIGLRMDLLLGELVGVMDAVPSNRNIMSRARQYCTAANQGACRAGMIYGLPGGAGARWVREMRQDGCLRSPAPRAKASLPAQQTQHDVCRCSISPPQDSICRRGLTGGRRKAAIRIASWRPESLAGRDPRSPIGMPRGFHLRQHLPRSIAGNVPRRPIGLPTGRRCPGQISPATPVWPVSH